MQSDHPLSLWGGAVVSTPSMLSCIFFSFSSSRWQLLRGKDGLPLQRLPPSSYVQLFPPPCLHVSPTELSPILGTFQNLFITVSLSGQAKCLCNVMQALCHSFIHSFIVDTVRPADSVRIILWFSCLVLPLGLKVRWAWGQGGVGSECLSICSHLRVRNVVNNSLNAQNIILDWIWLSLERKQYSKMTTVI